MDKIYTNIKERVLFFAKNQGVSVELFLHEIGMTYGSFKGKAKKGSLNSDAIEKILTIYPHINPTWLLTGKGNMLLEDTTNKDPNLSCTQESYSLPTYKSRLKEDICNISKEAIEGGAPFYDFPVSAGLSNGDLDITEEKPSGYINVPGIHVIEYFPVIGCSMQPIINPGDVVGVSDIHSWDRLDPDAIYFIATHDERMIKYLRNDKNDDTVLICISPNHHEFTIPKAEICKITKVVFRGHLV